MPARHDFVCQNDSCDYRVRDVICPMDKPESAAPVHCGKSMVIDWMQLPIAAQVFEPFVTRNIHPDGKPLLVRNKGDLQRYYQQYGVIHVDDPDLVAEGGEIRKKGSRIGKVFDMGGR